MSLELEMFSFVLFLAFCSLTIIPRKTPKATIRSSTRYFATDFLIVCLILFIDSWIDLVYNDRQRFGALRRLGLEVRMFKFSTMFIRIPNVQISTETQLLQNPC